VGGTNDRQAATERELALLGKYDVYESKVIDTKWVLKGKEEKAPDDPRHFKARLTARGFTRRPGIDFGDTYAPVCREESWRIWICLR